MGPAMKTEFPEVLKATRFHIDGEQIIRRGDLRFEDDVVALADSDFLDMFTFPLLQGDPATALSDMFSVIITEAMQRKYFGEQDPIGKTLNIE